MRLLAAVVVALAAAQAAPAQTSTIDRILVSRAGEIFALGGGAPTRRLTRNPWPDTRPTWTPNGLRIAFVSDRGEGPSLYVMNADGSGVRSVLAGGVESASWAPDGKRLVVARLGARASWLEIVDAATGRGSRLRAGVPNPTAPAWSPDGRRIAFAADAGAGLDLYVVGVDGGAQVRLTRDGDGNTSPAWSPSGRTLAFASVRLGVPGIFSVPAGGGAPRRLFRGESETPSWSPDARRVGFASRGRLVSVGAGGLDARRFGPVGAAQPSWGSRPAGRLLFPDLDQLAPVGLVVEHVGRRFRLGFDGATANLGDGSLHVRGERAHADEPMDGRQLVHVRGGEPVLEPGAGIVRYVAGGGHAHFHLVRFMSYELRTADGSTLVARDRKSGFCIGDRRGRSVRGRHARAFFGGFCKSGVPHALSVEMGASAGWIDHYRAYYHGQYVDVTGVPAGEYLLVHRSNAALTLLESDYDNNASSLRIALTWPGGRDAPPTIEILRSCPDAEVC